MGLRLPSWTRTALALLVTALGAAAEEPADLIVLDAKVTTLDAARPEAQALAVRDGVFVAVGPGKRSCGSKATRPA